MKNRSLLIRTVIIIVVTLIGIYMVFGPRHSLTSNDFTWAGIKNNLGNNFKLGLDLKGGSHLVMRVKTDKYLDDLTQNNKEATTNALKAANIEVGEATYVAQKNDYQVSVNLPDSSKTTEALDVIKKKGIFASIVERIYQRKYFELVFTGASTENIEFAGN